MALYGDKVYLATYDAALVALDARTGTEVWRTVKADYTQGFTQRGGPIIANGVVVSGINGCQRYKEQTCFNTGHDPDTGEEFWTYDAFAAVWGSPFVVDGKVLLGDEDGDIAVLRAGKEMELLGEYNLGAAVYCTPVAKDGVLYVLTRNRIWALQEGAQSDPL